MFNKKIVLSLGLSLAMVFTGGMAAFANEVDESKVVPISAPVEDEEFEFTRFEGKVEEINTEGSSFMILVKNKAEEGMDSLYAHIHEDVLLLSEKNMEAAEKEDIEVGMDVSVIYHKITPMTLSIPPQLSPNVILLHDGANHGTYVEYFNDELLSGDGSLRLRISDETVIEDYEGKSLTKDDIYERDLIIFNTIVQPSHPAQTTPEKIIVMPEREMVGNQAIVLKEEVITMADGLKMIPLRMVAESLDFEVTWNAEDKSVEILRGPNWSTLTIGENVYNFAKMLIKLEAAPIIVEAQTYVPVSFAEQVLQAEVIHEEDGSIIIK